MRMPNRWPDNLMAACQCSELGRPCSARTAATGRPDADSDPAVAGRWALRCRDVRCVRRSRPR